MHRRAAHHSSVVVLAGLASLAGLPSSADAQDAKKGTPDVHTVILTSGERKAGTLVNERATGVTITVAGRQEQIPRERIARIEYRDRPGGLNQGDRQLQDDPARAGETYLAAASNASPLFKPHCLFHAGRAFMRARRFDRAAAAFTQCLTTDPQGWFLREATRGAVWAHLGAGDASRALEVAQAAGAQFTAAGLSADEASLIRAEALEASGDLRGASGAFVSLAASSAPGVAVRAELGRARASLAEGSFNAAEQKFRRILDRQGVDRAVRASAARGLADALFRAPGVRTDLAKLRAAAAAYAEATTIHFPGQDDSSADREAALAGAAECYEALAALAGSGKQTTAERYLALARTLREELATLYGVRDQRAPGAAEDQ